MRTATGLKIVFGLIATVAIAVVVVVNAIDLNHYRGFITAKVEEATGRHMTIDGKVSLRLSLSPAAVMEGVKFANAPWGSRPEMATVKRFEAEVALLPLLSGKVEVRRLILVEPDILLETDAAGRNNWTLAKPAAKTTEAAPAGGKPAGGAAAAAATPHLAIDEIRIEKAAFAVRDGATKETRTVRIDRLSAETKSFATPIVLSMTGAVGKVALELKGTVGAVDTLMDNKPFPVDLGLKAVGAEATVKGRIDKPMDGTGIDLAITLRGAEAARLAELADAVGVARPAVPALGPFDVAGRLQGSGAALRLADLKASAGRKELVQITAAGSVADVAAGRGLDLKVALVGDDVAGAARAAGADVGKVPPVKLEGRLTDTRAGAYSLANLALAVGRSQAKGSVAFTPGSPPALTADIEASQLDLADFAPPATGKDAQAADKGNDAKAAAPDRGRAGKAPAGNRVFSDEPLPFDGLKAVNADVRLRADELVLKRSTVKGVDLKASLKGGRLAVDTLKGDVAGGAVSAQGAVEPAAGGPAVRARIDAQNVDLGRLLRELDAGEAFTGGPTNVAANLTAKGGSVRALMAGLSGDLTTSVGPGKLNNRQADLSGADLLGELMRVLNPAAKREDTTEVQCVVARATVKDGMATIDRGLAAETPRTTVAGSGTVNLKSEEIDLAIRPAPRGGVGLSAGTVANLLRLRGTLGAPRVALDEGETAKTVAKIGAAAATGGLSAVLGSLVVDNATADPTPCATALGKKPATQPAAAKTTGGTAAPAADAKKPSAQARDAVKGALKGLLGR